jgi:hypothetical protein
MTWIECAREELPGFTDEELDCVMWEETGYPSFWTLNPGETIEQCFRRQLREFKSKLEVKK